MQLNTTHNARLVYLTQCNYPHGMAIYCHVKKTPYLFIQCNLWHKEITECYVNNQKIKKQICCVFLEDDDNDVHLMPCREVCQHTMLLIAAESRVLSSMFQCGCRLQPRLPPRQPGQAGRVRQARRVAKVSFLPWQGRVERVADCSQFASAGQVSGASGTSGACGGFQSISLRVPAMQCFVS